MERRLVLSQNLVLLSLQSINDVIIQCDARVMACSDHNRTRLEAAVGFLVVQPASFAVLRVSQIIRSLVVTRVAAVAPVALGIRVEG